ncbi:MAG TPA: MFS transporter [Pseudolabrys sp.]|nr:MFS transporter [Pseudolabrys sp.]
MVFSLHFLSGPWRAVPVLGVTQILAWGGIYYTPVLIVPMIAREHGWSMSFAMGGFSFALLAAGLSAPYIGRAIDHFGGHVVMAAGSLAGALGLVLITIAEHRIAYVAVWILLGVALSASLYDAAFSTLGRIFGAAARRPITALTLAGGFASTVGWPATHYLTELVGWRDTYLIYAALLVVVAAPLHAFLLPRHRFAVEAPRADGVKPPDKVLQAHGWPFILVAGGFAVYAFVPSGLAAHLLAIFARSGIDGDTVVWIGALFGPAQVGARVVEFAFGRNLHPLWIARIALTTLFAGFVMIAVLGIAPAPAAAFAIIFGGSNGLITIARGAVPLALFGASGYGRLMGRLAFPFLLVQAAAPLVMAVVIDGASDKAALALACAFGAAALVCFYVIRRPAP